MRKSNTGHTQGNLRGHNAGHVWKSQAPTGKEDRIYTEEITKHRWT